MDPSRPKTYPHFDEPKKTMGEKLVALLAWLIVIAGIVVIVFLVKTSKPMGDLVCTYPAGTVPLTRFGTCHRE